MLDKIEKELRESEAQRKAKKIGVEERRKIILLSGILVGLITVSVLLFLDTTIILASLSFFGAAGVFFLYFYFKDKLKKAGRIRRIESVFPDFLQLMSSNLRAGMTIDKAMLLSSRSEFAPLDKEILTTGKEIATGKSIESALLAMSKRIKSEKIHKTLLLIISGIKAGGNLAVLLEETAVNIRERDFVEKRAGGSVLMYVIFVFLAVSLGAPILFSLSSVLVETLINILSGLPAVETPTNVALPFTLSSISISITFIKYFSVAFIIVTDILASLVLGLVSKGEEKEGLRYLIPILVLSIGGFFLVRVLLANFVSGFF